MDVRLKYDFCLTIFILNLIFLLIIFKYSNTNKWTSSDILINRNNYRKEAKNFNETMNLAEDITNFAIKYWTEWMQYKKSRVEWKNYPVEKCRSLIPPITSIRFNNIYWQIIKDSSGTNYFLYNAYYDSRSQQKFVRIIATQKNFSSADLWCLLYFNGKRQPILTKATKFTEPMHFNQNESQQYIVILITCPIPKSVDHLVPRAVSLTNQISCPKTVRNLLRVIYEKPEDGRQEFAVCHKSLRFAHKDWTLRLIEWLEMLRIFGTNKVFLYAFSTNDNMDRVLSYYRDQDFVDVKYSTLPGYQINNKYLYEFYANSQWKTFWSQEMLELNDCLYRNINKYKYIAIFDIDELIAPTNAPDWTQMMDTINKHLGSAKSSVKTYQFKKAGVYANKYLDKWKGSPLNTYMARHVYREVAKKSTVKCIHVTDNVLYVRHHLSLGCLDQNKCETYLTDETDGIIYHFRSGLNTNANCSGDQCPIFDDNLLRFNDKLEENIFNVLINVE